MENPRAGDARVKSQTGSVTAAAFEEALGGGGGNVTTRHIT